MLLLKILLILLLVCFPFGEIFRINLVNNIVLKPADIISVLILLWTVVLYWKEKPYRTHLKRYFFFFPLVGLISLLVNSTWLKPNELFASSLYLLRWMSYMSVFFAFLPLDENFKKKIIRFLIIDGIIILVIGYIQFFFYPSLRNLYYQGWDEHLYRMFSSFLDPNFVGAFFVLYFIFILGFVFVKRKKMEKKEIILYIVLLIATLVAIFLTYSRSALIMLLASGITFFVLLGRKKFILYLISAIVLFVLIISPFFYIENLDLFRVASSLARLQDVKNVVQVIQHNPVIGVGFNSYRYAQLKYNLINPSSQFPSHSAAGDDTSLLFVFATTGIIGLIAYCYLWYRLIQYARKKIKLNPYAIVFLASAVGLFVNALFNNSLFYEEIMFWMWMITGLVYSKE